MKHFKFVIPILLLISHSAFASDQKDDKSVIINNIKSMWKAIDIGDYISRAKGVRTFIVINLPLESL